jgi:hypothetical protein
LLPDVPAWDQRTITLIGERPDVERICEEWRKEGWQVMAIDPGQPTAAGHPTHVVRVAVPPTGWLSAERLLAELEG